jgi:hypothetical protein
MRRPAQTLALLLGVLFLAHASFSEPRVSLDVIRPSPIPASDTLLPGVGKPVVLNEIRVTLLGVKRLTQEEYRRWAPQYAAEWAGGGLRLAFHVENRPGAPIGPVLGEIRVLFGRTSYNTVTNAVSRKPFAPGVAILPTDTFFDGHGRALRSAAPTVRPLAYATILEAYIRGAPIERRTDGVVELEQGETHTSGADGSLAKADMNNVSYLWFRFRLPALD